MKRKIGVVNVFTKPYEHWSKRDAALDEALDLINRHGLHPSKALRVNDKLLDVIATPIEAAAYMLRKRADNGIEFHIDRALDSSSEYRDLQALMPQETPAELSAYQSTFPEYDMAATNAAINAHGAALADGQYLFHGGFWPGDEASFTTSRPFSTSFCPQVALRNADWNGKAYDNGRVDLMVVRVTKPNTKAFAYSRKGDHGHEKEVVFASGARLTRVRETHIADIPVYKVTSGLRTDEKIAPAYITEVEIS